jgi:hypothetical protein
VSGIGEIKKSFGKNQKGCGRSPAGGRAALGFWPYGVAGADDDAGGVVGEVAVGVAVVGVAVGVLLGVAVGVGVLLGVGVGVVLLGVAVGVLLCVAVGVGAGVVAVAAGGWIGWTRLGAWMRRPVSISAIAAAAIRPTTMAPPVETPAAKERRSRRYSVSRRWRR